MVKAKLSNLLYFKLKKIAGLFPEIKDLPSTGVF